VVNITYKEEEVYRVVSTKIWKRRLPGPWVL